MANFIAQALMKMWLVMVTVNTCIGSCNMQTCVVHPNGLTVSTEILNLHLQNLSESLQQTPSSLPWSVTCYRSVIDIALVGEATTTSDWHTFWQETFMTYFLSKNTSTMCRGLLEL